MKEGAGDTLQATVVKHTGSHYLLSSLPEWKVFPAVLRGKIRLEDSHTTNPVAVGDRVVYELPAFAELSESDDVQTNEKYGTKTWNITVKNPAVITEILPRRNYVIRRSTNLSRQSHIIAANVDRAFIIVTLVCPEIKLPFLDRLLVTCEVYNVPATIVLNKCDLYGKELAEQVEMFHKIYEGAGYSVIDVSATTGAGVEHLKDLCRDSVTLLSGVSGVGKSSLIRSLDPNLAPKIGDISETYLQGKHTTTFYEMYKLASGGFIIDTPGIRGFGLVDLDKTEIALYFPEMLRVSKNCKFTPCTHTHEPDCAVKAAIESGTISVERYNSYLGMLQEDTKYRY